MIFFIRHEETEYRVRVEFRDRKIFVAFEDEAEEEIDLVYYGHSCTFFGKSQVFFANVVGNGVDYTVWLPQGNVNFTLESEYRRIVSMLRGQALDNEKNLYAKMPGKVVKIQVKEGDEVKMGDNVLVMEAMKMENEIKASMNGKVARLCVSEGQAVETGELLMEFESDDKEDS